MRNIQLKCLNTPTCSLIHHSKLWKEKSVKNKIFIYENVVTLLFIIPSKKNLEEWEMTIEGNKQE